MKAKVPTQEVIDRLLIAKNLLEGIRFLPVANPDRYAIAKHVLTAHDAAELAIAGIAHHLRCLPKSQKVFLMDYFAPIKEKKHPNDEVSGRGYFSQLNEVRSAIKHKGIFPDPKQWYRVAEKTYDYISNWCLHYLKIEFADLDESYMISDPGVKELYYAAKEALAQNNYKGAFEIIACALRTLYDSNQALRNLRVGEPRAEDAIKLSAFGVHANEILVMQEFLPFVYKTRDGQFKFNWDQNKFGHYANWTDESVEFCLKTFVNVALRIQHAEWIPGAISFDLVYEHKVTALVDGVDIVQERLIREKSEGLLGPTEKFVVRTLKKGETIRGQVTKKNDPLMDLMLGKSQKPVLSFANYAGDELFWGEIEEDKVHITCIPQNNELVRKYFPNLPEMEYNKQENK